MKIAIYISAICGVALSGPTGVAAQDTDPCGRFITLASDQNYLQARALLIRGETDACDSPDYLYAKATVQAAFGEYTNALETTRELVKLHSDEERFINLEKRLEMLVEGPRPLFTAELKRLKTGNPNASEIVAMIENGKPVILTEKVEDSTYFPAVRPGKQYYTLAGYHEPTTTSVFAQQLREHMPDGTGPAVILPDSVLVFTAIYAKSISLRRPSLKLYSLDRTGTKSKPELLSFCEQGFNYFHPTYDEANKALVFCTDAPGGSGGSDLWRSVMESDHWGEPENMGPGINTPYNETFPFVSGDSLFYSSDRPDAGFGGVDVYLYTSSEIAAANLGLPVNSPYNDFGMRKSRSGTYYFTSDRPGRLPGDDVFIFTPEREAMFFRELSGKIEGLDDPEGVPLHLLTSDGDTLQTALLGSEGLFSFDVIRGLRGYQVVMEGAHSGDEILEMKFFDRNGEVFKKVTTRRGESFIFQLLLPEDYYLGRMYVEDTSILDISITGQYLSGNNAEPEGIRIILQDAEGESVAEAYTEKDGFFKFESISPDAAYTITADGVSADDVIHVLDSEGRILQTILPDTDGRFFYVRLAPDVKSVTLTNERKETVKVEAGTEIDLPDVFFELNKSALTERGLVSLQKLLVLMESNPNIRVELEGHTDSRGDADYNLKLSRDRIASVVAYLTGQGVERSRISGKGYGERRLRNHCKDGIECSEDEHAVNRRTEFKIYEIND